MIPTGIVKRLATQAAIFGAMVMDPVQGLFSQMSQGVDSLSAMMSERGYEVKRINYKNGYDLEPKTGTRLFQQEMALRPPKMTWVSLPCTRISPLTNLTQQTEHEQAQFEQRQNRDMKRADEVSQGVCSALEHGQSFAWEWPTGAAKGWRARCIS